MSLVRCSQLSFSIPSGDALEFANLPEITRDRVRGMLATMEIVAGSKAKTRTCSEIADTSGVHFNTIYGRWKAFRDSGGDWRVLIDKRHTSEFWKRDEAKKIGLPADFVTEWKFRVESNDRASKPAWTQLIHDWRRWRAGDQTKAIPGYQRCPEPAPGSRYPFGWGYSNLLNYMPSDVEIAAARKGRVAAKNLLPGVTTTRILSYPFAEIQFDDMWHNFGVNAPGRMQSCRLLEFGSIDQFSTYLFTPGLKPRLRNMDTGRMEILNSRDFHLYVINWLLDNGVHPDGTVFNCENGTAALRKAFVDKLLMWFGGRLTVVTSGMSGAPAFPGAYKERAKGNYKAKALKEGMGGFIQNALGHLPGQVGMDRNDSPASLVGREKENEMLLCIAAAVPGLREKLRFGNLDLFEAVNAINEVYHRINRRDEHQIEGWAEAGFVVDQFRFSSQSDDWRNLSEISQLPAHEQELLALSLKLDPKLRRPYRLTPAECIESHRRRLIRLPHEAVPDLLGPEYGETKEVRSGLIAFTRPELGKLRYKAHYQDAGGFIRRIENGSELLVHLNPWKPDFLYLSDPKTKRFLGRAPRDLSVDRGDIDAIHRAHGEAERDFKDAVREVAARHGIKRIPHLKANTAALREAAKPSVREREVAAAGFDAGALLDPSHDEAPATADASAYFDPADLL